MDQTGSACSAAADVVVEVVKFRAEANASENSVAALKMSGDLDRSKCEAMVSAAPPPMLCVDVCVAVAKKDEGS